jgi:hypothetical protein
MGKQAMYALALQQLPHLNFVNTGLCYISLATLSAAV